MRLISLLFAFWALSQTCYSTTHDEGSEKSAQPSAVGTTSPTLPKIALPFISPDDEESILSVTVWFKSTTLDVMFHYTQDGTEPSEHSSVATTVSPILLNKLGTNVIKCYASKDGMQSSEVATRTYNIIGRCVRPIITPNYGTFESSVEITLTTTTPHGKICYNLDSSADPSRSASCVESGSKFLIDTAGKHIVKAITVAENMADSTEAEVSLHVITKVATPLITPEVSVFPVVAMLVVKCSTANATIYYTLDGTDPTESSYTVISGNSIIVDSIGSHVLKAFAVEPSMLSSDIVRKEFVIQRRMAEPLLLPRPDTYTGDMYVTLTCPETSATVDTEARVYYTTDGIRTPTEQHSESVPCGGKIALSSPSSTTIRAIAVGTNKVASSVVQGVYVLLRPAKEEHPVNPAGLAFSVQPDVDIVVVEKNIAEARVYCSARNIRGRLIILRNPVGHFDIVPPLQGCTAGKLALPSVSGRDYTPTPGFNLTDLVGEQKDLKSSALLSTPVEDTQKTHLRKGVEEVSQHVLRRVADTVVPESEIPPDLRLPLDLTTIKPSKLPWYLRELMENQEVSIRVSKLQELDDQYEQVRGLGCQVVSNAGFFNVTSNACLGDVVSKGVVHQLSDLHNVNFGIRNGSFVVGYVEKEEILDPEKPPFDFLISGLGWLVRGGKSYVKESFSLQGDAESMKPQATGPQFVTVHSARTALGHDADGNLMLLQVEGETWVRGMTLYEFADFAAELGFHSAINLDGGDSATLTQNHSLISEPSWKCTDPPFNSSAYFRCEKPVSSITCIHAMAPPFVEASVIDRFVRPKSVAPTPMPTPTPSVSPSASPSQRPSARPTYEPTTALNVDDDLSHTASVNATSTVDSRLLALQSSAHFYQLSAIVLLVTLLFSIGVHIISCVYCFTLSSGGKKRDDRSALPAVDQTPHPPREVQMTKMATPSSPPAPSQGISSQYAAIPSQKPAQSSSILSYLPSLTGSGTKRLVDTPPEPSMRSPAGSPRPPTHKSNKGVEEEELRDISDWKPPGSLMLIHTAPKQASSSGGYFGRSAAAAAATKEEEDFYRDEDDDEDCTDSSRLLQAPSRAPDPRHSAKQVQSGRHNQTVGGSDSESSEGGRGFVRKPVALKAPKSGIKPKAKSTKH